MNKYEITIITKENPPAGGTPVKKEIEELSGKILSVTSLGQKQLVFPIKKERAGYYSVINFEIEPTKVLELNQKLGLSTEILRHLILVAKAVKIEAPKKPSFASSDAKAVEDKKATEEKKFEKLKVEEVKEKVAEKPKPIKKPVTPRVAKKVAKIEEEETSTKERLKALDKKLDELLKE